MVKDADFKTEGLDKPEIALGTPGSSTCKVVEMLSWLLFDVRALLLASCLILSSCRPGLEFSCTDKNVKPTLCCLSDV